MDPNVLEGALTPQDLFNLSIDTQARWDHLSSVPNDFSVPAPPKFPEYDLGTDPLAPETQLSLYDGLFSQNPHIKEEAQSAIANQMKQSPGFKYNVGYHIDTPYDIARPYVGKEWGFDPTRDNQQFYHEQEYANKGLIGRTVDNAYKGLGRLVGTTATKLGQEFGHLGYAIGGGLVELFSDKLMGHNFDWMGTVAENAITRWFEHAEETIKQDWLPVYKPSSWSEKGFFEKLGSGQYWSDELADGAAFMASMIAESYIMGGLGRAAGLGSLGAKTITGSGKLARLTRGALKLATGADDVGGIATWALSVSGEAMFEAADTYKTIKQDLLDKGYTPEEAARLAGDRAAARFKGNLAVLSLSNAFENRMLFQPLLKKLRGRQTFDLHENTGRVAGGIEVSKGISPEEFAKARSARPEYTGVMDRYFNLKKKLSDPQGALRFYGSQALKATVMEGYWEENAQLALERLANKGQLTAQNFVGQYLQQTYDASTLLGGKGDQQNAESIGAGMIIGVLGSAGTSAMTRERRNLKENTLAAIKQYNNIRRSYLDFQAIYERDADGNFIKDEVNGGYQINLDKAKAALAGIAGHMEDQEFRDSIKDPVFRQYLNDQLLAGYVFAAKQAGIHDTVAKRFEGLSTLNAEQTKALGFDSTTVENLPAFQQAFKEQSALYDEVFHAKRDVARPKGVPLAEFEGVNESRKADLYDALTIVRAAKTAAQKYSELQLESSVAAGTPSNSIYQLYNSALLQGHLLDKFEEILPAGSTFYTAYLKAERERIGGLLKSYLPVLAQLESEKGTTTIEDVAVDFDKYSRFFNPDGTVKPDKEDEMLALFMKENDDTVRHAQLLSSVEQYGYVARQLRDEKDGYTNYQEYLKHKGLVAKVDDAVDKIETPEEEPGKKTGLTDEERNKRRDERSKNPKDYTNSRDPWAKKGTNGTKHYRTKGDNRVREDVESHYGIADGTKGSLKAFLQKAIDNPYTHPYVAEAFRNLLPHVPDDATIEYNAKQTHAPGYYTAGTRNITVDPDVVENDGMSFEGLVLHELIHLLTSDELLKGNSAFAREITELYNETLRELGRKGIDTRYYGFKNVHEFLAEAYSNPEFQAVLQQAKSLYGQKSLWNKFIDILTTFLKETLGVDITASRLDDLFFKVEDFLNDGLYNKARKALKDKGLTDEDLKPYSKTEVIQLAIDEGLIEAPALPQPKVEDEAKAILAKIREHIGRTMVRLLQAANLPTDKQDEALRQLDGDGWLEKVKPRLPMLYEDDPAGLAEVQALIEDYNKALNPTKDEDPVIGDEEWKAFVDNGTVTPERITSLAQKVIDSAALSPREQAIFNAKTAEVEAKVKELTPPPRPRYVLVEDKTNGFGLALEDRSDYWYDEKGQAFWSKSKNAALKKLAEVNGDPIPDLPDEEDGEKPVLTPESLAALEEAFQLAHQGVREGKSYNEMLEDGGYTKKENRIDSLVDEGKMTGTVVVPTMKPNDLKDGAVDTGANPQRLARFRFLQFLSDTNNRDGYKLKLVTVEKNGRLLLKGKVVNHDGEPATFDLTGKPAKGGHTLLFDLDLISYDDKSLNKSRLEASGLKQNPLEKATLNFRLHDSFTDGQGKPLPAVDDEIVRLVHEGLKKEALFATIVDMTQGQLYRDGITNAVTSLTDRNATRTTLAQLVSEGHTAQGDRGVVTVQTNRPNNTYVRGGRLNVMLRRDLSDEAAGFEVVQFRGTALRNLVDHTGAPLVDRLRPVLEAALKGQLDSEGNYKALLKTLLNKRGFLVLDLGKKILVVNEEKFTHYLRDLDTAQSTDLTAAAILGLTTLDEVLDAEMNVSKELYESTEDPQVFLSQFPAAFHDLVLNYRQLVMNNMTTSAKPLKVGESLGYNRVNKRLVVSLDKPFGAMASDRKKQEQETIANDKVEINNVHGIDKQQLLTVFTSTEESDLSDVSDELNDTECA